MNEAPRLGPIPLQTYFTFAVSRLGIRPSEFWQMTFGEFWPLYNAVTGNIVKPLSALDLEGLEERWINGNN